MLSGAIMIGVGLLLVILEFFLPGAIMGVAGGVIFILGLTAFALNSPSILLTLIVFAVSITLLIVLIKLTLKRIQKSKSDASIYLKTDQGGYKASTFAKELIGKQGIAKSDLKPAGHISVEGEHYQALSRAGYLSKGSPIEVIGGQGAHLIVKAIKEQSE